MAVTLTYRSTRAEIWRWYSAAWRRPRGLWRYHLVIFGAVTWVALRILGQVHDSGLSEWPAAAALGLLSIAWLPLWPLVRFKPQERRLVLDEHGLTTTIGTRSGGSPWRDVRLVDDRLGVVAITLANECAYLVPARAFSSEDERTQCLRLIREWHRAGTAVQTPASR